MATNHSNPSHAFAGSAKLRPFMERLLGYDNIPRNKKKFVNFAKNSLNLKADRDGIAEQLWDVIGFETAAPAVATAGETAGSSADAGSAEASTAGADLASGSKASSETKGESRDEKVVEKAAKETKEERKEKKQTKAKAEEDDGKKRKEKKAKKEKTETEDHKDGKGGRDGGKRTEESSSASAETKDVAGGGEKVTGHKRKVPLAEGEMKPIKWKKIITKELETCGGRMNLKDLRKVCIAEARAHPSHGDRQGKQVGEEFDAQLSTFHKFSVAGSQVTLNK